MANTEQLIRERAYLLWEQDGQPEGRDLEYWERARSQLNYGDADPLTQAHVLGREVNGHNEAKLAVASVTDNAHMAEPTTNVAVSARKKGSSRKSRAKRRPAKS